MRKIIIAAAMFLSATLAAASEPPAYQPFPESNISREQWEAYRAQVLAAYGPSLRRFPDEHLEVLHSPDGSMNIAFTTEGHPAHPAWITRRVQTASVNQAGFYAGELEPFDQLFRSYIELTHETINSLQGGRGSAPEAADGAADPGTR